VKEKAIALRPKTFYLKGFKLNKKIEHLKMAKTHTEVTISLKVSDNQYLTHKNRRRKFGTTLETCLPNFKPQIN
jgi:hypothetical protein